jgi:serine/threonine protein kinase
MLCFNPNNRITAEEALHHPFLASFKGRGDESLASRPFSFDFERSATSMTPLKTLFLKEVSPPCCRRLVWLS